jgi:uncharacterized phage protein (TIGR01671 family)
MYEFRGYNNTLHKWIYGKGMYQHKCTVQVYDQSSITWTFVDPKTLGRKYVLNDASKTTVYRGDVVRQSFKENDVTYNKYYVVKEDSLGAFCEELWRDYSVDPDTFEISRLHNVKYSGDKKYLNYFSQFTNCKVLGNIWQNPELIQEEL